MGVEATDVTAAWGTPLIAIHCSKCGEAHLVKDVPPRCPFCLAESVEPQPAYLPEEPPEQAVDYQITDAGLRATLGRWTKSVWFRPDDMTADVLAQRAQRYLVPLWLVDGQVQAAWRADVGFDYQVVSSQDRYLQGGGWVSQEVKEKRVRWEPRVGRLERRYENLTAPALDDHRKLMGRLGRYNIGERAAYTPDAVSDGVVRIPTLEPDAAWPGAETAFAQAAQAECQQAAGADHIRDFTVDAQYSGLNWTLLLLPAYVTWYEEGGQVWPVLINGQIGHVSGVRRSSAHKAKVASLVIGAIAALLLLLGGLLSMIGLLFPPVIAIGGIILLVGVLPALVAPVPAITVWAYNRRSEQET
ncbi:MAG: hypothetical protein ACK2US_11185 [Anaerolineae bacterium]|jgi:hypothetical protein